METCKNHTNKGTQLINIDGNLITNQQSVANSFNNYFLTAADNCVVLCIVLCQLCCSMYCLCVNVYYCHRASIQLQLNIPYHIISK